jgi:SAM-dependent methyltransferase
MKIPWLRRNFLARRWLDRMFLDAPDYAMRAVTGRSHWPPYSLRAFVGGAQRFDEVGRWFLEEFRRLDLFRRGSAILDIGCGCGRLAYTLATDEALRELEVSYAGMDVDRSSISWCQRHITPLNPRFVFYHADCYNPSYNPAGTIATARYRFPHEDSSLNLVLMTSVLTHVLEEDLRHYLDEVFRLLAPGGIAYASFFLYQNAAEAAAGMERHGIAFPFSKGHLALNREDYPTNAVAYDEAFVRSVVRNTGLRVVEPARYGIQDLLLLERPRQSSESF